MKNAMRYKCNNRDTVCYSRTYWPQFSLQFILIMRLIEESSFRQNCFAMSKSDEAIYSNVELLEKSVLKIWERLSLEWIFHLEKINKIFSKQQFFAIKKINWKSLFSTIS